MDETKELNFDEISIYCILKDIIKNLWVILLAMAAAWFAVTGTEGLMYVPEYTASATLAVSAKGNNANAYSSLSVANQMAEVFSEVFDSSILREKIAEELGQEQVEGKISSSIIEETNLIVLTVTSVNPRQAYMMIQSAINNYDTVSDYLFSNAVLRVVKEPTVPYSPSNQLNISKIRKLAMLGAGALTGGFIILFSILRFTVKTKEGAKRNLDGRILEVVPYERKYKTVKEAVKKFHRAILISSSLISLGFSQSIRKTATQLERHMKKRGQKVLLVSSVSENEGKSSIAANIALAFAEKGRKVILLDADLKKPAQYKIFDQYEYKGKYLTDFLEGKAEINQVFHYEKKNKLYMIFQRSSVKNSGKYLDSEKMRTLIEAGKNNADYIIIDSSPMGIASDGELLLKLTDTAVLVVRQDWADIRAINDAADNIRRSGTDLIGFLLNSFKQEFFFRHSSEYRYYGYRNRRKSRTEEEE